ncbi:MULTISPECIES: GNAT family N-acetyltransferase [Shewanella]|uniref:Acetyltransferase (GNAT) family protein n=1 Tax=Shewanella chilikensis TaxID=558541 RepID=A0A6G7LVK7_9GAMM|nr:MULTISPECIES: GNAT family N-acetyltransferase [Shewanella]MCE9852144.1 GNAT family N-acetyltransferase [Shewanella chilikensis]MCL1154632.1 GNAT family N-acetyltransferase [Shewanella chilikensis]MCL1162516.1 GNAT family N-acetyltransferase [Shewanella chilikensis]PYE58383.1 acetyltransferase (GNAT) family protein [Shewanella chilikensis]QIJ05774.1 GNAT family N-acetyltransferase [Shewanella chilikensis]
MLLRKGTPKDTEALVAFNQAMAQETEGLALDSDTLSRGVSTLLENPAKGFYLVAEIDGEIAGSLMVTYEWSDWRAADYFWIQSVYIKPEHRRKGIYRALYQEVKALAERQGGAASFRLYVEQENSRAQQTYQSLGMSQSHYLMYEEKPT